MAGFEGVVRPVVFPDIRPSRAQSVRAGNSASSLSVQALAGNPNKGSAVIRGNGGQQVSVSSSYSASASTSQRSETERRVDETRVYQKDDDGNVNKKNFVDIDVANRIKTKGPPSASARNRTDLGPMTGDDLRNLYGGMEKSVNFYQRPEEKDNIEILNKNVIKKKGQS
jgi:hypothetical protein